MTEALRASVFVHFAVLAAFAVLAWVAGRQAPTPRLVKIALQEVPTVQNAPPAEPVVQVSAKPKPVPAAPVKPVFGVTNDTWVDDGAAVAVKTGNTLAKDIDREQSDGKDSLPIPAAEYLVTKMPRLRAEVRIPYPAEARAQNIEGAVVMNVLIDETGKVREAMLLEGPGHGLNEAALEAIYRFQFEPAEIDQKAVAVRIRYAYRFVLN